MKIKIIVLINLAVLLYGCGRTDNGYIVNSTNDTVYIIMKLNYPANQYCPENYLREQLITKEKSNVRQFKLGGDCLVSLDTTTNIAELKLNPNDEINLGTIRAGLHRNNYKMWEFTQITIASKNLRIEAKDKEIMDYIETPTCAFGGNKYAFIIKEK